MKKFDWRVLSQRDSFSFDECEGVQGVLLPTDVVSDTMQLQVCVRRSKQMRDVSESPKSEVSEDGIREQTCEAISEESCGLFHCETNVRVFKWSMAKVFKREK